MQGTIQSKYKKLFTPTFRVVIMGQMFDVSLSQAENEAEKYALTGMGHMYEDFEKLQKEVKSRQAKLKTETLDMNKAERGSVFKEGLSDQALNDIDSFKYKQTKGRNNVGRRKSLDVPVIKNTKKKAKKKKVIKKK